MLEQASILPLKERKRLLSKILVNNTQNYNYVLLIKNDILIIKQEVKRAIYKIVLNKILGLSKVTNQILQYLVSIVLTQVQSLFAKYIKKRIQLIYFK